MGSYEKDMKIAIIGSGLVGSLASIFLAKRGYNISVYERRSDMRKETHKGGRSINLALSNRGWLPLKQAGVIRQVEKMVIPMKGRIMHSTNSELTFQPYGQAGQAINSISRAGLNELLINTAEDAGVEFYFQHVCKNVDIENTSLTFETLKGTKDRTFDLIAGCDGAFSTVRSALQKSDRFNYSQSYIPHGYKELSIPPGSNGEFQMEKNALHIWPRGNFMLIALPNLDGSFTVTLFLPFEGENSFQQLSSYEKVKDFFKSQFPDAFPLLSELDTEWNTNPASSLVTVRSYPWVKNRIMLMGDAAHAVVPFYGQGMNCGFEDCRVLNDLLDNHGGDWNKTLPDYEQQRKPDADAIADLALQNFVEMRDLVGSEEFLLRKRIEAKIQAEYPDKWIPLYSMVTFNENIRYSEALEIGKKQAALMDKVMGTPEINETWESMNYQSVVETLSDSISKSSAGNT